MQKKYTCAYQFYSYDENSYFHLKKKFLRTFHHIIEERIPEDLNVSLKEIVFSMEDRPIITLEGDNEEDLVFMINILKEITGMVRDAKEIRKGDVMYGLLKNVGKFGFGLFVDVGIKNPEKDVLLPLHYLRDILVDGEKMSLTDIVELYGFMNHFPVEIKIVDIEKDKKGQFKYNAEFSDFTLERFQIWVEDGFEMMFSTGVARQSVKKTIAKRGHTQDTWEVRRLGPLETATICRTGTTAPGLIAHIGKFLPDCHFSALRPQKVRKFWDK